MAATEQRLFLAYTLNLSNPISGSPSGQTEAFDRICEEELV